MTSRSRGIQAGDGTAGARLEYVRSRRVLRLGGWHRGGSAIEPIEVPLSALLPELGIAPEELGAAPVYLLLAGVRESRTRAVRRTTTAFSAELEARQAFRRLRSGDPAPTEWADLFALDVACRLKRICWFGEVQCEPAARAIAGDAAPVGAPRRRWRGRRAAG